MNQHFFFKDGGGGGGNECLRHCKSEIYDTKLYT